MYKVLPDARLRWRDMLAGSAITAALFTIGNMLLGLYLGRTGPAAGYGAAGSLVLILLWIYYSSIIVLFGAELTQVWVNAHGRRIRPKPGAVRVREVEERPDQDRRHPAA